MDIKYNLSKTIELISQKLNLSVFIEVFNSISQVTQKHYLIGSALTTVAALNSGEVRTRSMHPNA